MSEFGENCLTIEVENAAVAERSSINVLFVAPSGCLEAGEMARLEQLAGCLNRSLRNRYAGSARRICGAETGGSESTATGLPARFWGCIRYIKTLARAIPRCRTVHVFHLTGTSFLLHTGPAVVLSRFFGKRVILDYRSHTAETELDDTRGFRLWLFRFCDRVVVSSDYLRYLLAGYGVRAEVVSDVATGLPSTPRSVTEVQPRIVVARPLEKFANVACLLRAFRLVKQKYPRAEMTIIGDGSARGGLEGLAAHENILGVTFVGSVDPQEAVRYFDEADLYVNSSSIGAMPTSMLAAMAAGLPVVTTDAGGIGEIIRDGINGLTVRVNDAPRLADAIIRLVETPELVRKLSEGGRRAAQMLSWENVGQEWLDLYTEPGR